MDDASLYSNTNPVSESDPPSGESSHKQGDLETKLTTDILVREHFKRVQKNHSVSNIIVENKLVFRHMEILKSTIERRLRTYATPKKQSQRMLKKLWRSWGNS